MQANGIEVPYAASVAWYRGYLSALRGVVAPRVESRLNRCLIMTSQGPQTLTVPVDGGRNAIRHAASSELALSLHGDWPRVHMGAWNAAYGKTPFYEHVAPSLAEIYRHLPPTLGELNAALHGVVMRILNVEALMRELRAPSECLRRIARERSPERDGDNLSVFHLIFNDGPSAIFSLLDD